jgi:hypothetical protein
MRVPFSQIFSVNLDGSVSPKVPVAIGGITMGGPGVTFGRGAWFAGVEIAAHVGKDLEVVQDGEVYRITAIY